MGDSLDSDLLAICGTASVGIWQLGLGLRWLKQVDGGEVGQVGEAGKSMPAFLTLAFLYLSDDSNGFFLPAGQE